MRVALPPDQHPPGDGARALVVHAPLQAALHEGADAQVVDGLGGQVAEEGHVADGVVDDLDLDLVADPLAVLLPPRLHVDLVELDGGALQAGAGGRGPAVGAAPLQLDVVGAQAGHVGDQGLGGRGRVRRHDQRVGGGALALLGEGPQHDVVLGEGTFGKARKKKL